MPGDAPLLTTLVATFSALGVELDAVGLAWARVLPTVTLVPAFGLRALPGPARAVMGLALAVAISPALVPLARARADLPWALQALEQVLHGLPVAVAAATPLWAATMAGGVLDTLRGAQDAVTSPVIEGRATPLGVPFTLVACSIFFLVGGPAHIASVLAAGTLPAHPVLQAARDLTAGIGLAVALAGPLLAAAVVMEVAGALVARAASPAQVHALIAPLRSLGLLALLGLVFDRIAALLATVMAR